MESESGGVGRLLSITTILVIAVGGLAMLRFDVMGLRTWLTGGDGQQNTPPGKTGPADPRTGKGPGEAAAFDPRMPEDTRWKVDRAAPLPPTLTVSRKVGQYTAELELVLVPQGWFAMGEDDGVVFNQPKKWVWCSDFYIARTETTNAQYFAFILDNGYARSQFWTQAGFEFARDNAMTGTEWMGWLPLGTSKRARWLSAPSGDVTIELRNADGSPGRTGAPVLVLPERGAWENYFSYDSTAGKARLRARGDNWEDADGEAIARSTKLLEDGFLKFANEEARVYIEAAKAQGRFQVVTWPDGNRMPSVSGTVRRDAHSRLIEPRMPAVSMSWYEADACARFWGGRLPWECWWEKAGRSADGRFFPWGNDLELTQRLPHGGRMTTARAVFNRGMTEAVGRYPAGASPYGVLDMVGNVSEWTADAYVSNLLSHPMFEGPDPHIAGGPRDARSERGSKADDADEQVARLYNRRSSNPFLSTLTVRGFRMAFTAEEALKAAGR